MRNTYSKGRGVFRSADIAVWEREHAQDNSEQMDRLRRNLRRAREQELTPRQREMLSMYYEGGMSMPQIAERLGVNRSTVSRTIRRARERLHRVLRYTL